MFSAQASQVSDSKLYADDVFSTYLYTGNGSTQTINNGIDLAGKGGLVWIKPRNVAGSHYLQDTARGATQSLYTNSTAASGTANILSSFTSTGFVDNNQFASGNTLASWTFRKAARFFDCGTYTGNGASRQLSHSLGVKPGMVIIKRTDATGDWLVQHTSTSTDALFLNTTAAATNGNGYFDGAPFTSSVIYLSSNATVNASGATYVWYAFAHDTSAEGIIQCGSFTTDGSGNATVNHGWSAGVQFAKIKASSTTGDWEMFDSARSPAWSTDNRLRANLSNAEDTVTRLSASGTSISFTGLSASQTYIYVFVVAPT